MKRASVVTYDILVANFNKTLPNETVEKKVSKQFTQYGETKGLFVKENNQGKYVVVKYLSEPDADRAVSEANGVLLDGMPILVKRMERRPTKPPGTVSVTGGTTVVPNKEKAQLGKNPDIVPTVEPKGTSSPGPDGEVIPLKLPAYQRLPVEMVHLNTGQCQDTPFQQPALPAAALPSYSSRGHTAPLDMYVTHIETPTLFWCQELLENIQLAFRDLENKLASVGSEAPKITGRPDNTKVYAAQYSEDGEWYRCQVKFAFNPEKVKVQYIDYGNCEEMNPKDLVELPADIASLKPFAEKVMMHNTRYLPNKDKEAIQYLKDVIGDQQRLIVHPTFRLPDGTGLFAQLFVGDVNLNQTLIDNGFAMTKPPKQQQQTHGDSPPSGQFHLGDGGGYIAPGARGFGGKPGGNRGFLGGEGAGRQVLGEQLGGSRFGATNASRTGAGVDKNSLLPEPMGVMGAGSLTSQAGPAYSDLKIELQNKNRVIEKTKMEVSTTHMKIKTLQQEYQLLTSKLEENNLAVNLRTAANIAHKVRRLRSQFSDDKPTAVDDAIQLASSSEKLTENSVASLAPVMTTLTEYRRMQQEICQAQTKEDIPADKVEERDALRRTLYEQLTACVKEMEGIAFTERAQQITECTEKLMTHYDNFFNVPVESTADFITAIAQYEEFKAKKKKEFEQSRLHTDQQHDLLQAMLVSIGKVLSLTEDETAMDSNLDLSTQLKQYITAMQLEVSSKNVEASTDGHFISALVQSVHRDLKEEILCINNFLRLESEFRTMQSSIETWLDKSPTVDKLVETRQSLRLLKSKLRHKLADKHDAEENEDKEMMEEVQRDVASIQREIHDALIEEDKELTELATLVDSHFPEFLVLHPDCGLDIQLKYKGMLKTSHEVNHYNLTAVPGSNAHLFFSRFADQDVIIMECLLSDSHHLGREDFLTQLMVYTNIIHPALLRPSAVFFDKNNRHAYLRFERRRGEILANHIEYAKPDPDDNHLIVKSVGEALAALHSKKVLHGEINPYSILHHSDGTASLLPPDLSCRTVDRARNKYTSPNGFEFRAPEMLALPAGVEPTGVVDMFCVGILILYLSSPRDPAPVNPDGSIDLSKVSLSTTACSLVKSLTSHVPHLRSTAEMLLQSRYVLNAKEDSVTAQSSAVPSTPGITAAVAVASSASIPAFSMPNTQHPPPPFIPSGFHADPSFPCQTSEAFSSLTIAEPKPFVEPNGSAVRNSSPFSTQSSGGGVLYDSSGNGISSTPSGYSSSSSFDCTPGGFESSARGYDLASSGLDSTASGFDEAALQQAHQEKESRSAMAQFSGSSESGFDMDGGRSQGEFEIGTFSIDDVNTSSGGDKSKGRKITRQVSAEEELAADTKGLEEWQNSDDQTED